MKRLQDKLELDLLPALLEEADELLPQIVVALRTWRELPGDEPSERKLQRSLHTFKGSARMVGAMQLGEQIHLMESRVDAEESRHRQEFWEDLQRHLERIGELVEQLRGFLASFNEGKGSAGQPHYTRPTSMAEVGKRLHRVVQQVADELHKKACLELSGAELELDARLLKKILVPLEHLLRNAVVHGVELPAERLRKGKPALGCIRLALSKAGDEIRLEVADDGAGLDLEGLRRKAEECGLLQSGVTANNEQLMQLIFAPGVSTVAIVTEISGFGIGLDAVRSDIAELGGRIGVNTEKDSGTRFTIHLPQFLAPEPTEK